MKPFQQKLWGYTLVYPDGWVHKSEQDIEAFAAYKDSLQPNYEGDNLGHLLIRGEFNPYLRPIESLWNQHIAKMSVMLGARKLGSAPLKIGEASGFEVEIVLPKRDKKRLWVGILSFNATILHLMVLHLKENRNWFEPFASKIVASIRFVPHTNGIITNSAGIPLPPNIIQVEAQNLVDHIQDPKQWEAYDGTNSIAALQNFFVRELPVYGWEITTFEPFPSPERNSFARFFIQKEKITATLAVIPEAGEQKEPRGKIVIKYD